MKAEKAWVSPLMLTMAPLSVPVSHVGEHVQYQSPGSGSPKWIAAIINIIHFTCALPALTSQNVCIENG